MIRDNLIRLGRLGALFALVAAALSAAPAGAVVGPSELGARFADHVVMVLSRGGDREGFCTGIVLGPRACSPPPIACGRRATWRRLSRRERQAGAGRRRRG